MAAAEPGGDPRLKGDERNVFTALWRALKTHTTALERQNALLAEINDRDRRAEVRRREAESIALRDRHEQRMVEEATGPERLTESRLMFVATFASLRTCLVDVPATYYERVDEGVRIACRCRDLLLIPTRNFFECDCGRVYCATDRTVKVMPLEDAA